MQHTPSKMSSSEDPEQNVADLGDLMRESHENIIKGLRDRQLQLGDFCTTGKSTKVATVYRAILTEATNGNKLIKWLLDQSVMQGGNEDVNHIDSHLRIDFGIFQSKKNFRRANIVIKDLIDFKTKSTRALLSHPVIESFINFRWTKWKKYFMVNFVVYLLFLTMYSMFLGNIFYRKGRPKVTTINIAEFQVNGTSLTRPWGITFPNNRPELAKFDFLDIPKPEIRPELTPALRQTTTPRPSAVERFRTTYTFKQCRKDFSWTCGIEVMLILLIILLVIQEIIQFLTLGPKRYFSEFENWLEWTVYILATLGMIFQRNYILLKWVSAFGVPLAYLEFIFLLGRYPMLGGSISLIYYTITRHLLKTLLSLLILICGFAFGFFIIHHESGRNDNFENPGKSIFKTLAMVVGEFEFDDLYDAHEDQYALAFTMMLLTALIILGTLVLINLLIGIIVSDLAQLRQSGHVQELVNKVQHIVQIETAIDSICCFYKIGQGLEDKYETKICVHTQCQCDFTKMDDDVTDKLNGIVRKRQLLKLAKNPDQLRLVHAMNYHDSNSFDFIHEILTVLK